MQFREKALKKLSTPEELKTAVAVTSPMSWVLLCVLLLGFTALLGWGISGTIQTHVIGPAFVVYQDAEVTEVVALVDGTLTRLDAEQGDSVEAGAFLGTVANPALVVLLEQTRQLTREVVQTIDESQTMKETELAEFDRLQALQRAALDNKL